MGPGWIRKKVVLTSLVPCCYSRAPLHFLCLMLTRKDCSLLALHFSEWMENEHLLGVRTRHQKSKGALQSSSCGEVSTKFLSFFTLACGHFSWLEYPFDYRISGPSRIMKPFGTRDQVSCFLTWTKHWLYHWPLITWSCEQSSIIHLFPLLLSTWFPSPWLNLMSMCLFLSTDYVTMKILGYFHIRKSYYYALYFPFLLLILGRIKVMPLPRKVLS